MLRHQLLIQLFCMTAMLVILAVLSIWVLEDISADFEKASADTEALVAHCGELNKTAERVESHLYERDNDDDVPVEELLNYMDGLTTQIAKFDLDAESIDPVAVQELQSVVEDLSLLSQVSDMFVEATDGQISQSKELIARIHSHSLSMMLHALEGNRGDHRLLNKRFRTTLIVIAVGFLATINICILLLLRTGLKILRPVDLLVESCRQMIKKRIDIREKPERDGEFAFLAATYQNLSKQLQENEDSRIDTIKHVSLAINHELNNTLATIDLELQLLKRRSAGGPEFDERIAEIEKNLRRMAKTVATLGNIRRIVLTEYISGTKMLDLDQSAKPEISVSANISDVAATSAPMEEHK